MEDSPKWNVFFASRVHARNGPLPSRMPSVDI
jgi:hypothetical protein